MVSFVVNSLGEVNQKAVSTRVVCLSSALLAEEDVLDYDYSEGPPSWRSLAATKGRRLRRKSHDVPRGKAKK
jgi:hypothetical protein